MPVNLIEPKQAAVLDQCRVVNISIENNPHLGQRWIDLYVVYGRDVDGNWEQHVDPLDAAIAQYYRITPGCNPHARPSYHGQAALGNGPALGRCDACEVWHVIAAGPCSEDGCDGTVQPYDGFSRIVMNPPTGATIYDVIKNAVYDFLITEQVPDPVTGEIRPLLAAVVE